jgi:hypothetical protein
VQHKGLLWELENYVKDEKGNYPTTWDHAIDTLFYFVNHALPSIDESIPRVPYREEWEDDIQKRDTFESLFRERKQKDDFAEQIQEDFYDYEEDSFEWIN